MPSSVGWNGTATTTVTPLAAAWGVGNTPTEGTYNVVQGVLVRCTTGGNVNAAPAPSVVGKSTDGGGNVWFAIGRLSSIELLNVDATTTLLVDGFTDKDAGATLKPSATVLYRGNQIDASQIFVWTAASTAAWSVTASS